MTPSYHQARFLEATIRSVLLQGYPQLEYMVVDGGSSDGSVEIIRKYERWLTFWISERDRGQSHAINKGLDCARGEVFGYLNSDDLLAPGGLAAVARMASAHPDVDVFYGKCQYIDRDGRLLFTTQGVVREFLDYLRIWDRLRLGEQLTQPEVLCRTQVLRDAGGFREDLHSLLDYEMWLRLLAAGRRFQPVDAVVARFRVHAGQKSQRGDLNSSELSRVVNGYLARSGNGLSATDVQRLTAELRQAMAVWQLHAAAAAGEHGLARAAWQSCIAALCSYPPILGTYGFWTTLAGPIKRRLPANLRKRVRTALAKAPWPQRHDGAP